jgi:hypothetical protein
MKKYISYRRLTSYLGFAALLSLSACDEDKLLNTSPPTSLSSAYVFDTPDRVLGLVKGIYKGVKSANFYGGRYLLYLDVRGEDFINVTSNVYTAYESWNNSYSSGSNDIISLWASAYSAINLSNILIDGLAKNGTAIDATLAAQYTAEAKFLRALSYYSLVTIYARPYNENNGSSPAIPLRLSPETTPENNGLKKSTVAEIYAQIIKDLNEAEAALPENYSTPLLNTTRAHKNTARALKTRVFLNQKNWDKVIEEAVKIVPQTTAPYSATAGVKHQLQNISQIFTSDFTSTESILSVPFTSLDSYGGQSSIAYIYGANSEYYLNPQGIGGDSQFSATDARRGLLKVTSGRSFLTKFGTASPFLNYIPVIRYSEILLNYAEAAANKGQLTLAANLLKAVHARSDANYTFAESALATNTALINAIWKERRIELLGEGFRSNDLLRNNLPLPAKSSSTLVSGQVSPSAENYIFPISNAEIVTNKLL